MSEVLGKYHLDTLKLVDQLCEELERQGFSQEAKELQNEYEDDEPDEDEKNSAVLGTIMPMVLGTLSPSPLVRVNSTTKWTAI